MTPPAPLLVSSEAVEAVAKSATLIVREFDSESPDSILSLNVPEIVVCGTENEYQAATDFSSETFIPVNASADVGGVVGDIFGVLFTGKGVKSVMLGEQELPAPALKDPICVSLGASAVAEALRTAAGCAGIPCVVSRDDVLQRDHFPAPSASLLLRALRFSLLQEPEAAVRERGFYTLVGASGSQDRPWRPTALLWALLADDAVLLRRDHESACADLLERFGHREQAAKLRSLIQHWIQLRLWTFNRVPEMVLHDDAHAVAVDRNVAALAEPLLRDGHLTVDDVITLACVAWLHDWGHSPADYGGKKAQNPEDVRSYHGLFSAQRIQTEYRLLGLEKGPATLVALLSGHHQGWTSCGNLPPSAPKILDETSLQLGHGTNPRRGPYPRKFDDEFASLSAINTTLQKAHLLLAITRLADALDIGIHRVPDYRRQGETEWQIIDDYKQSLQNTLRLLPKKTMSSIFSKRDPIDELWTAALNTANHRGTLLLDEAGIYELFENHVPERLRETEITRRLQNDSGLTGEQKDFLKGTLKNATSYIKHVLKQTIYYSEQRQIRAIIPVLEVVAADGPGFGYALRLHVLPQNGCQDSGVRETVHALVAREIGEEVKRADREPEPEKHERLPIKKYLGQLGIQIEAADEAVRILERVASLPAVPAVAVAEPAGPAPNEPRSVPLATAYPAGLEDWISFSGQGFTLALTRPEAGIPIATDIDGQLATAKDGTVHFYGDNVTYGPASQPISSDGDTLGIGWSGESPSLVLRQDKRLVQVAWDENLGGWAEPLTLLSADAEQVSKVFVWDGGDVILVTSDGDVKMNDLHTKQDKSLPHLVWDIDVLRHNKGTTWWAWISHRRDVVFVANDAPGSVDLEINVQGPQAVWWVRGMDVLLLIVETGPNQYRSFPITDNGGLAS